MISPEVPDQPGCRIDHQRGAADDQNIRSADRLHRTVNHRRIKRLLVQYHIRFDDAAALRTVGNMTLAVSLIHDVVKAVGSAAVHAIVAQHRSVKFKDLFAAGLLMQPVDVLRHDGLQLAHLLQTCQCIMRCIGFCIRVDHVVFVVVEEGLRILKEEAVRDDFLR